MPWTLSSHTRGASSGLARESQPLQIMVCEKHSSLHMRTLADPLCALSQPRLDLGMSISSVTCYGPAAHHDTSLYPGGACPLITGDQWRHFAEGNATFDLYVMVGILIKASLQAVTSLRGLAQGLALPWPFLSDTRRASSRLALEYQTLHIMVCYKHNSPHMRKLADPLCAPGQASLSLGIPVSSVACHDPAAHPETSLYPSGLEERAAALCGKRSNF